MNNIIETLPIMSPVGETNTYIIVEPEQKQAVIVDPAGDEKGIAEKVRELGAKPTAILLTHAHYDHIGAAAALKKLYGIPVYCGIGDKELLLYSEEILADYGLNISVTVDNWLNGGEKLSFGKLTLEAIATPGHSQGSICYLIPGEALISGDTLFYESVGRTDFNHPKMHGDHVQLLESLDKLMSKLGDDITVYPGHGCATTIGHERRYNPFI